ncbi:hypothetical protein GPJ56_005354 [Histomonas meleagridis]|uniref:uncharacterized protein n=1 Tax=Histomonas meleagridis TaxID=135588 RepID=UPI00355A3B05|nr:hypothetical protein GPJ56_005354 [Histomonas meleagridis]KAH0796334.1 hypothetical protein GO595_010227 [Histomonas meleagridis]
MENQHIVFRIYKPENEELKKLCQPIETEPREALETVERLIEDSKNQAPDVEGIDIQLAPPRQDNDIKRIMQPSIDELLDETKAALIELRKSKAK